MVFGNLKNWIFTSPISEATNGANLGAAIGVTIGARVGIDVEAEGIGLRLALA